MYRDHHVLFIEEGQFFDDLYEFCIQAVERDGKHVIVCGLDGDFERRAFGHILDLVPIADTVDKLRALCAICKDGTEALFSKRLLATKELHVIGGLGDYLPVCRYHYHQSFP
jgi:thymidine kinase